MLWLIRARTVLRVTALSMAVLFLNVTFSLEMAALFEGTGISVQSARAQAAERKVAVFVLPSGAVDTQAAAVLNSIIRTTTDQLQDVSLVTAALRRGEERLVEAERLADTGFQQLDSRNTEAAQAAFGQALSLIQQQALGAVPLRLQARVEKGLGCALFLAGKKDDARDHIKKSIVIFERQTPTEYAYTLELKNFFREVRQELQDRPVGSIEVASQPAGAEVYLDHELKGYTLEGESFTLGNLVSGPHFVRVVLDGYYVWSSWVEVEPAGTANVDATLTPGRDLDRFEKTRGAARTALAAGADATAGMKALGAQVGASEVLVLLASQSVDTFTLKGQYLAGDGSLIPVEETVAQDATLLQNLRAFTAMTVGGEYAEPEMLVLDSPAGATEELTLTPVGAGAEELVLNPDSPIFAGVRRSAPDPVYKKWWFWTIIGVVAAGATTGIVLLTTQESGGGGGPTGGVSIDINRF